MSDRRLIPANARVAHRSLEGQVTAERFVDGTWRQVAVPVADILVTPGGKRDRQALFGEHVLVLEEVEDHAFVRAARDGYCGYIRSDALGLLREPTHWVSAPATHVYSAPDFKSPEVMALSFGSYLSVTAEHDRFVELRSGGFVPAPHVRPVGQVLEDPVTVAESFLGTPYLWGGNSRSGIDCSGLAQAALMACGIDCPGDSDLQEQALGHALPDDAELARGDLLFWKGHVALCVDAQTMIHANVFNMAVVYEPIEAGIARIAAQGDGPVTSRRRL